jgi:hypothetical protein
MSEEMLALLPLASCLFCQTAEHVRMAEGIVSVYNTEPGFWVMCNACGLRGPWRLTKVQANAAWERTVTAHKGPEEGQEKER